MIQSNLSIETFAQLLPSALSDPLQKPEPSGDPAERGVAGPERNALCPTRSQDLNIAPAQPAAPQSFRLDQAQGGARPRSRQTGQAQKLDQKVITIPDRTAGQFPDDHRMSADCIRCQQFAQTPVQAMEMIDPNRTIYQNLHAGLSGLRRRPATARGSLPPRLANSRAASRWIKASKPRWSKRVFSLIPVYSRATARRSSSRFSVVLMQIRIRLTSASVNL